MSVVFMPACGVKSRIAFVVILTSALPRKHVPNSFPRPCPRFAETLTRRAVLPWTLNSTRCWEEFRAFDESQAGS